MKNRPFKAEERLKIIDRFHKLKSEYTILDERSAELTANKSHGIPERMEVMEQELQSLRNEYRDGLPKVVLSRCPICNSLVRYSIDTFGIDGLWWDYKASVRRRDENCDAHFLALSGALHLNVPVHDSPFLICAGPQVPFVIPRLLDIRGVKAVMSSVKIGEYTGYPIFYFADPYPVGIELTNEWGSDEYRYWTGKINVNGERAYSAFQAYDFSDDYDFDLAKWLESGKLFWIDPHKESFELSNGTKDCPFLSLFGPRQITYSQNGATWFGE